MAETLNSTPLVSVVVITYNSSKYVLETLESIKNQTYKNIELVISDDCSTDETVAICQEWVEENKKRFVRTEIVEVEKNTGVAPNCNRGLKAAQGEWVKLIAGDDLLCDDGIEAYVRFVLRNPDAKAVISDMEQFGDKSGRVIANPKINKKPVGWQFKRLVLLSKDGVPFFGPAWFHHRKNLIGLGGYDERYPMIEDYPTVLRLLDNGIKIYALNHVCVRYRVYGESITKKDGFSKRFFDMYAICALPILRKKRMYFAIYHFRILVMTRSSKTGILSKKAFRYLLMASSPYAWLEMKRRYID